MISVFFYYLEKFSKLKIEAGSVVSYLIYFDFCNICMCLCVSQVSSETDIVIPKKKNYSKHFRLTSWYFLRFYCSDPGVHYQQSSLSLCWLLPLFISVCDYYLQWVIAEFKWQDVSFKMSNDSHTIFVVVIIGGASEIRGVLH